MPSIKRLFSVALFGAAWLLVSGCSTTTTMKLSGTPGTSFTGHYRSGTSSFDVSGAVPLVVEVPGTSLQECEFRKSDAQATLALEIRHGKTQVLQGTAGPGTSGLRAQDDGGWHFQIIR